MKNSTKLLSVFSVLCMTLLLGLTASAQSITVTPGLTATQMAQLLVGTNVTVTNATYTGATDASGSFNQATSTFPLSDGIILTSGDATNALGPNNATGSSATNGAAGDADLEALVPGFTTFDASVLEFDVTSNCNTLTFDYIFASEEYLEYGCSSFNDVFGFFITGPGFTPNTNIALIPGTTTPVSIDNVINSPATNCVANPTFYVDNAGGVSMQYDGRTVTLTATANIQPCQTYHIKIAVADAGDSALDSAIFLKGGGINCSSSNLIATANITGVSCGALGAIDLTLGNGTGPFTYSWIGPNGFTATTQDITGLAAGDYVVEVIGSGCLSTGEFNYVVPNNPDVTPPVIANCPGDIIVNATNSTCIVPVNFSAPTATDDCPNVTLTSSHNSGDNFSVGTTAVTYTATDASGNTSTCTFNVTVNAQPLVVTLTPLVYNGGVNILCFGGNSGSVSSAVTGGCSPYTYSWSTGGSGTVEGGLSAGPVSLTVTDGTGTSVTETVTLIQNPAVAAVANNTPILCNGGTTDITITATGGTAPYMGTGTFTETAGTYTYTITDANGCSVDVTTIVTEPTQVTASASSTLIDCNGGTSDVTVTATGGTAPYTGTGTFTETVGMYTYTVTDANGCSVDVSITVTEPTQLTAAVSSTSIDCNGGTSDVTVTATGGTAPYTGTGTFTETVGMYTYTVTDANGCSVDVSITVTEPTQLTAAVSSTSIDCNGGTSDVTVTASGGTAPYTGTGTFTETAGMHTYTVTDANGCSVDVSITVAEPTQLTAAVSSTSIDCNGGTSDVTVTASGGTAPYTGTGTFTETAGMYTYTVTDANGCSVDVSITLAEPTQLTAAVSSTSIDCNGGTSDVTVTASGGTAPYTGTGTFTETAGVYTYTVTDANGCSVDVSITVAEPTQLTAAISSTSVDCNGGTSDVTVTASGGTAPYSGTGTFTETAGMYTYTVTDANGCSVDVSITVAEPTQLTAAISSTSIDCNGGTSDVTVTASGGTAPYTGTGTFTETAGVYTYTVTDANGCSVDVSITVAEPTQLTAAISSTSVDCNGGTSDVTVTASGGTAPYSGTGTFTETAGTYTYTVTDANGCSVDVSITVTEPTQLTASASSTSIDCNGGTSDVTVAASGGTAPYTGTGTFTETAGVYTYTVTDANGCSVDVSITITEPTVMTAFASCPAILCNGGTTDMGVTAFGGTPPYTGTGVFTVGAGTYTYTITDANGCTASVTHVVTEPSAVSFVISYAGIDCNGGTTDVTVSATGGTAPYTGSGIGTFNVAAGTYTYTATDANGCIADTTITVTEPTVLVASSSAASILCNGGSADVTVTATGGTAPYTGTGTFSETAGTYTYTVTDANGCTSSTTVTLTEPTLMTAYASCPVIDCNGGTADIAIFAFGGTPPYSGTGVFNVGAGTYTYTITDANGCTADVTHTVTEPSAVIVTLFSTGIDCNGGTADVTVTATGGTAPYTGTGTFNVVAGTYSYTVTDANGCTATETITVAEPAVLVASSSAASILCNGGSADVTVTATGGTAPYTGTGTFSAMAGTVTYTVTDANGCTATTTITLTEPTLMTAFASCPTILCNGGTADIAVTAFGGTPPYTGGGVFNVGAGTYTYTLTDANGCTASVTHTVIEPSAIVATATVGALDCVNETGDVTIAATGGTAPYTGTGTFVQANGTTTYTVTDANGCTTTVDATVEVENFVDLACPGDQTFDCNYSQNCGSQNTGSVISWNEPTASSFSTCDNGCGPNTQIAGFIYMGEHNGSRYYCSNSSNYSWQAANTAATIAGGHLATISSSAENQFVSGAIGANVAWIGYTDQNVEGTFEWINGESVTYENWTGNEPNNNGPTANNCGYCGEADYTVIKKELRSLV